MVMGAKSVALDGVALDGVALDGGLRYLDCLG